MTGTQCSAVFGWRLSRRASAAIWRLLVPGAKPAISSGVGTAGAPTATLSASRACGTLTDVRGMRQE
jgi:hypothetical protein